MSFKGSIKCFLKLTAFISAIAADAAAVAFICEHTVRNTGTPVVAAWCKIREMYYGNEKCWRAPDKEITVREAVDRFQEFSKSSSHQQGKE